MKGLRRWFSTQPIHRKLVLTSMAKTTVVLCAAMLILLALDSWRFQRAAQVDADTLASLTADNIRAALAFDDAPALAATLGALRMSPQIQLACAYRKDGLLVSAFARDETLPCPNEVPAPPSGLLLASLAPVQQNEQVIGHVYLERDWSALTDRLLTAGPGQFLVAHAGEKAVSDRHYLFGWALAYYLTFDRQVLGTPALDRYVVGLRRGSDPVDAFRELVGAPLPSFEEEFHRYLLALKPDGQAAAR